VKEKPEVLEVRALIRRLTERWLDAIERREALLPRPVAIEEVRKTFATMARAFGPEQSAARIIRIAENDWRRRDAGGRGRTLDELAAELDHQEGKLATLLDCHFDARKPWADLEADEDDDEYGSAEQPSFFSDGWDR
jgi:hypothetical protein